MANVKGVANRTIWGYTGEERPEGPRQKVLLRGDIFLDTGEQHDNHEKIVNAAGVTCWISFTYLQTCGYPK